MRAAFDIDRALSMLRATLQYTKIKIMKINKYLCASG